MRSKNQRTVYITLTSMGGFITLYDTNMTNEEKLKRIDELRRLWVRATTNVDRKNIEIQGKLLKKSLPKLSQIKI